jgi:hypothetical protein
MNGSTPLDAVLEMYELPFELREYQVSTVNSLAPLPRAGYYKEVGTGKTASSTVSSLFKQMQRGNQTIVLMPPILIKQWFRWLAKVRRRDTGVPVSALMYRGTPKVRAGLALDTEFILMSMQIFKNDYARICGHFEGKPVTLLVDEATSIKNVTSDNHRKVRDFINAEPGLRELMLLTGTPLSKPGDAYAYIKLVSPQVYRNQHHFEAVHVAKKDFFGNVTQWDNLEFLAENLLLNSVRVLKHDALPYLNKPNFIPLHYELDAAHMELYRRLAQEQLLITEQGGKIDATTRSKLYTCLQQIVCNPGHFSGNPSMRSAAHELLDAVLDELNGEKLIVAATYRMTNRGLLQYLGETYNAVGAYGEISAAQVERNKERFIDDDDCKVFVIQPSSAGYGTDGLQEVCSEVLFLETPIIARDFHQVVGRVDRDGQKDTPNIRIGIAEQTIQVRLHNDLLAGDALVNKVQGGFQDLRDAIYGVS